VPGETAGTETRLSAPETGAATRPAPEATQPAPVREAAGEAASERARTAPSGAGASAASSAIPPSAARVRRRLARLGAQRVRP
jgi:guanosine-3',5'-bis(diphosphate) 3'-pyrophosphohydrolase